MERMFESIKFESQRLISRKLVHKDKEVLFAIYSDKEAMKFRGSGYMKAIDEARNMIDNQSTNLKGESLKRMGIIRKSDNVLIGTLLLKQNHDSQEQCEVGFSFGKKFWNNGYGYETLLMMLDQLEKYMEINEVIAWSINENVGSIRLFEKAGFTEKIQSNYPESKMFCKKLTANG